MTDRRSIVGDLAVPLPIAQTARITAEQFALTQPTPERVEQVRLNTLAVCVVHEYLQMMDIPTDLTVSDCWNPFKRLFADIADIEVTGVGRLECRPLRTHEQTYYIPPEVWEDRIGYVVVQIDESLREASILGFVKEATEEKGELDRLRPVVELLYYLYELKHPATASVMVATNKTLVNLSQWLMDVFEAGWQAVEEILKPVEANLEYRFRIADDVRRAKLINLERQTDVESLILIVGVMRDTQPEMNIWLELHPTGSQTHLPPELNLMVLDEQGESVMEAEARSTKNLQFEFSGLPGERFSVKVALGDVSVTEAFVV